MDRDSLTSKLHDYQVEPVEALTRSLSCRVNTIDGSKCGAGKTYVAAAVIKRLQVPTLVVCPKVVETSWKRAAEHIGVKFSIASYDLIRTGYSPYGSWDNNFPRGEKNEHGDSVLTYYVCQSCQRQIDLKNPEPCYCHPGGIHCVVSRKRKWNYGKFNWHPGIRMIVFDEAHRCSAIRSLNAEMMVAAKRQGKIIHLMTATPAMTPLNMRALGYVLDLHSDRDFFPWVRKYGCGKLQGVQGLHWLVGRERQQGYMRKLHDQIFPARGVSLDYKDIPGFPDRVIEPELYDLQRPEMIDKIYSQMAEQIEKINERGTTYVPNALTDRLIMRQRIEMEKVPLACELAEDYVAKGNSVVLFVNFTDTLRELAERLKVRCKIDGSQTGDSGKRERQRWVDAFQADDEPIILVNTAAGGLGIGLQDIRGERARVGLVMPPESALLFIQLAGRLHRKGGMSPALYKVLLAANTVETKVYRRLNANVNNIEALTDEDFDPNKIAA